MHGRTACSICYLKVMAAAICARKNFPGQNLKGKNMETINGIDFLLAVGVILSSVITWACTRRGEARRAGFLHELLSHHESNSKQSCHTDSDRC